MVRALTDDGAEVHVIVTAREPLSLFTSSWQEHLKNKGTAPISEYAATVSDDPTVIWNWRALDLRLVLERWGPAVDDAARLHVITPPGRDQPRDELWARFCSVLGISPSVASPESFANASMGVVEAETLRRINPRLEGFDRAFDRGVWIRSFLADDRLVPRGGEPYWPGEEQIADCRAAVRPPWPSSATPATTSSATSTLSSCLPPCPTAATPTPSPTPRSPPSPSTSWLTCWARCGRGSSDGSSTESRPGLLRRLRRRDDRA